MSSSSSGMIVTRRSSTPSARSSPIRNAAFSSANLPERISSPMITMPAVATPQAYLASPAAPCYGRRADLWIVELSLMADGQDPDLAASRRETIERDVTGATKRDHQLSQIVPDDPA